MKNFKGYKTLIFNIIALLLPFLEKMDVTNLLNPANASIYLLVVSFGNIVLRFYTTSPIFKKDAGNI